MKTATGRGAVVTGIPTRITDPFGPDARWTGLSATVLTLCFLINGIDGANVMQGSAQQVRRSHGEKHTRE